MEEKVACLMDTINGVCATNVESFNRNTASPKGRFVHLRKAACRKWCSFVLVRCRCKRKRRRKGFEHATQFPQILQMLLSLFAWEILVFKGLDRRSRSQKHLQDRTAHRIKPSYKLLCPVSFLSDICSSPTHMQKVDEVDLPRFQLCREDSG